VKITLPLPGRLTSHFIVPVERIPFDIESFVPWRVGRPYRRAVSAALGSPLLTVTHHRTPWRPAGVTLAVEERHLLRRAQQHVMISSTAPPHALPTSVQVARAAARAVAQECEGLVIDPLTGITLLTCERHTNDPPASSRPPTSSGFRSAVAGSPSGPVGRRRRDEPTTFRGPGEPPAFRLADDWLGWDVQVHGDATCPPWDPADTGACDCLRVTSRGLRRFALPEITLDGAACAHTLCATSLLRRVADHLIADHLAFIATHPDATERLIDDHQRIETSAGHGGSPFTVHLTPCDADPTGHGRVGHIGRLKVGPSPGAGQVAYLKAGPPPGTSQVASLNAGPPPGAGLVTHLRVGPPSGFTGSLND
jgi:hypothetical protein